MWNWRMLAATGDRKYADVIERALYNGINSGMSLSGTLYCYRNPLAFDPGTGDVIRNEWYDTTCCPPNLERTFASLPGYFYSTSKDGIFVHLFHNSELNWHLEDGTPIKITQKTNYPWDDTVHFEISPGIPKEFTLYLRRPEWSRRVQLTSDFEESLTDHENGYFRIRRRWSPGDKISLILDMTPQLLESNSRVTENNGRVAVQRGPLVYCLEELDQPAGTSLADVSFRAASGGGSGGFSESFEKDLLGGVMVLRHEGAVSKSSSVRSSLYFSADAAISPSSKVALTFIPYYAWANRRPTPMLVWTPLLKS